MVVQLNAVNDVFIVVVVLHTSVVFGGFLVAVLGVDMDVLLGVLCLSALMSCFCPKRKATALLPFWDIFTNIRVSFMLPCASKKQKINAVGL